MYGFIYITTNLIDGKRYIGQRKYYRKWKTYLGSGIHISNAIKKYGKENFKREIIEECETKEQLDEREKYWIAYYDAVNSNDFYNISEGGEGGNYWSQYTEEERKIHCNKISESNKGKNAGANKHNSRKVICLNTMKIFDTMAEASREMNVDYKCLQQCCSNDNQFTSGVDKNTGERLQWSYYEDGKDYVYIPYVNPLLRKVVCLNTREVFNSIKEAENKYNATDIGKCCRGKRKSTGKHPETNEKLKWMYYEDYVCQDSNDKIIKDKTQLVVLN